MVALTTDVVQDNTATVAADEKVEPPASEQEHCSDDEESESQIVMDSDQSDGEYLVYTGMDL